MASEMGSFEAARVFAVSPAVLVRSIAERKLDAHKDENGKWRISRRSLEAWNKGRLERRRLIEQNAKEREREAVVV